MATGDAYSRLVLVAKIVLPLIALAILSTLFLLSRNINPENAIPYAEVDVEQIAAEQRLTLPQFSTVGSDGAAIEMSAAEARPDPGTGRSVGASEIRGRIDLPSGATISVEAGTASVDMDAQIAGLSEDVRLESSLGYRIEAVTLTSRLDRAEIASAMPVSVETPFGNLEAGDMKLTRLGPDYRLVFNNKVKLVYLPQGRN